MKKITVVNNINGMQFGAQMEDPTAWIAEQTEKESWGKNEYWVEYKKEYTIPILDENGNQTGTENVTENLCENPEGAETTSEVVNEVTIWKYKVPCEYTVTITDIDADPTYLMEEAIKKSSENIEFGKYILSIVGALVQIKNLDCAGVASLNSTFSSISMLLQTGSIETAKGAISAITPDSVVTQNDIDYIVGLINNYLGI